MPSLAGLLRDMEKAASPTQAANLARFFKTGPGGYGEGDRFLGIKVPVQRQLARKYASLSLSDIGRLLSSKYHEHRLTGLLILDWQYGVAVNYSSHRAGGFAKNRSALGEEYHQPKRGSMGDGTVAQSRLWHSASKSARRAVATESPHEIVRFYLSHLRKGHINNWDLVDLSAPNILGDYILSYHQRKKGGPSSAGAGLPTKIPLLTKLARSKNLWERRAAVVATAAFIRKGQFSETLRLAEMLLRDKHDLIHKATGWMLREVGKRNQPLLELFLRKHAAAMPRTMLRYAIERLPEGKRKLYMSS